MKTRTNISDFLYSWITNKEKFYELTFTQDGSLFVDSALKKTADSFFIYYNGNVFVIQGERQYCDGALPKENLILPTVVGETSFHDVEGTGCLLHSKEAVLEEGTSVFAVFSHSGFSAMYMADSMVSRAIHFFVTENSPEEDSYNYDIFIRLLHRHDPEAAKKLAFWVMDPSADFCQEV